VGRGLVFVDARFSRRVIFQSCHARHMRGSALSRLSTMRFPYFFRVRHGNSSSRELSSFRNSICAHVIRGRRGGGGSALSPCVNYCYYYGYPAARREKTSLPADSPLRFGFLVFVARGCRSTARMKSDYFFRFSERSPECRERLDLQIGKWIFGFKWRIFEGK